MFSLKSPYISLDGKNTSEISGEHSHNKTENGEMKVAIESKNPRRRED